MMEQKFAKNARDGVSLVIMMLQLVLLAQKEVIENLKIVHANLDIMMLETKSAHHVLNIAPPAKVNLEIAQVAPIILIELEKNVSVKMDTMMLL